MGATTAARLRDMDKGTRRMVVSLTSDLIRHYEEGYRRYRAERADYIGQGYRPRYCEHGMNLWVDWDPICGPCEDGLTMGDPVYRRSTALEQAKERVREAKEIYDLVADATRLGLADAIDMPAIMARTGELLTVRS